jgi:hypothetical protein
MMRRIVGGVLAGVIVLVVTVLPPLATALLTIVAPSWPIWLCAASGVALLAIVVAGSTSPHRHSDYDDSDA